MKYNQLGRTGLLVSELCLGTMTFGGKGFWQAMGSLGQNAVDDIVKGAKEAGINFIDTADVYSEGESEQLLGQALKSTGIARSEVVIATKAYGIMGPGPNDRGASRGHLLMPAPPA
jgi:aryl-alcohol dehydrogenase-like predicted oxidoreductase